MTDESSPDVETADRWVTCIVLTLFAFEGVALLATLAWLR